MLPFVHNWVSSTSPMIIFFKTSQLLIFIYFNPITVVFFGLPTAFSNLFLSVLAACFRASSRLMIVAMSRKTIEIRGPILTLGSRLMSFSWSTVTIACLYAALVFDPRMNKSPEFKNELVSRYCLHLVVRISLSKVKLRNSRFSPKLKEIIGVLGVISVILSE
jgi:hypothetical protein